MRQPSRRPAPSGAKREIVRARPMRPIADFIEAQKVASLLAELLSDGHPDAAPLLREAVRWLRRGNPAPSDSASAGHFDRVCSELLELAGAA